jgi:predicted ATP-grasp superfamily ATP-dependent carboligase
MRGLGHLSRIRNPMKPVLVVGSGHPNYRRYLMEGVATRRPCLLLNSTPLTWQSELAIDHREADLSDPVSVLRAAGELAAHHPVGGVFTWEEGLLEITATISELLGVPGISPSAARACRDKARQRDLFAKHGVPSPSYRAVDSLEEAATAAGDFGYPVIVKPRALAGSIGVRVVRDVRELEDAVRGAQTASWPGLSDSGGVLVEEYLTGPEYSVDSWVLKGEIVPFVVARKSVGLAPYCEEIGHVVGFQMDPATADAVGEVVRAANCALGVDHVVTHTEVMLTAEGPKVIEVNGRLGGDLIPYLGQLATGVSAGSVAADVAVGVRPLDLPMYRQHAGIHFVYPPFDMRFEGIDIDPQVEQAAWLDKFSCFRREGDELRLPPRGFLARIASAVYTADDEVNLGSRLERIRKGVTVRGSRLSD